MKVTRYDNILRYHVQSDTRSEVQHLVELDAFEGNGACSCEWFNFRLREFLEKGAKPDNKLRCKHIMEARGKLCDDVIQKASQQSKPKKYASKD